MPLCECSQSNMTVRLPSCEIGGKRIRFLYFRRPNLIYTSQMKNADDIPLFLGADVLFGSSQSSKNHCRIHSRYAKDGLATKITFNGLKIEGINHSANMWFYTVQGLFNAAFEHLDITAQRDCLVSLKDVWISTSMNTWSLSGEITVSLLCEEMETEICNLRHVVLPPDTCTDGEERKDMKEIYKKDNNVEQILAGDGGYSNEDHHESADISENLDIKARESLNERRTAIDNYIKEHLDDQSYEDISLLKLLVDIITVKGFDGECYQFLINTFHEYYTVVTNQDKLQTFRCKEWNISTKYNVLLCVFGNLLGDQFTNFSDSISRKVETFKLQHINDIDNLPSAEELVEQLFPKCMEVFMVTWMQTYSKDEKILACDHEYSFSPKKRRTSINLEEPKQKSVNIFPLVQLILEFANNVLISGVAHVLYSRLLSSN